MDDGAKKAGGFLAAVLAGIGGLFAHGADDCARIGARSATSMSDDVARVGFRSADDLAGAGARYGDDLAGAGRYGDDLAGAGRYGDDLGGSGAYGDDLAGAGRGYAGFGGGSFDDGARGGALGEELAGSRAADDVAGAGDDVARAASADGLAPSYGPGRTGSSFGGGHFAEEVVEAVPPEGVSLSDDVIETAADLAIDAAGDVVQFVTDDDSDEPRALPVLGVQTRAGPPDDVRVLVLSEVPVAGADRLVRSLPELDDALANGSPLTVDVVVLPPPSHRLRATQNGYARSDEAILVRSARLGRRAILAVCGEDAPDRCIMQAALAARAAAIQGASGLAEHLEEARDRSPSREAITLRRLHEGHGSRVRLATSP